MKLLLTLAFMFSFAGCTTVDLFEKTVAFDDHEWPSANIPQFNFEINDTSKAYRIFLVLRHNERYNFNNIWLNVYTQAPGENVQKERVELVLATNEKGWLASGMKDIYEHRLPLALPKFRITRKGSYKFALEQVMREDPLQNVMNAGIRIEKVQ